MKAYSSLFLLGIAVAVACSEPNKRRHRGGDSGEGGEDETSGGANGTPASGGRSGNTGSAGSEIEPMTGGSGAAPATGGASGRANSAGDTSSGGTEPEGSGGSNTPVAGNSSNGGSSDGEGGTAGSVPGSGGSSAAGSSNGGTGATDPCGCTSDQACDQNEACVAKVAIDDFASCDDEIPQIEGRSGTWGDFSSEDVTYVAGVSEPGSGFGDLSCAAWMTGGAEVVSNSTYAGAFVTLDDSVEGGAPYSLSGHTGIRIVIESLHQLVLQVRTVGDGYFGIILTPDLNLVTTYDIPFSYLSALDHSALSFLDLTQATEIQVTVPPYALDDFAFAIHYVGVY